MIYKNYMISDTPGPLDMKLLPLLGGQVPKIATATQPPSRRDSEVLRPRQIRS